MNIWDYGLENEGRRDLKFIFSVTSVTREVLRDSILLTVTASSARACPKFLAMFSLRASIFASTLGSTGVGTRDDGINVGESSQRERKSP